MSQIVPSIHCDISADIQYVKFGLFVYVSLPRQMEYKMGVKNIEHESCLKLCVMTGGPIVVKKKKVPVHF